MGDKINELTLINELSKMPVTKEVIASDDFTAKYELLLYYIDELSKIKSAVDAGIKNIVQDNYIDTGDSSVTSSGYRYTYVPGTTRETLNTKAFKADHPDLYKEYVKVSDVAPSLRIVKIEKKDV